MIYDRLVFIIIVSILSSLANSMAIEAKASINFSEPITTSNSIETAQNSISTPKNSLNNSDRSIENPTAKESSVISRHWGFVGMAIVSLVSLILLKLMFTPPANEISSTSKTIEKPSDREMIDTPDSIGDLKNMLHEISPPLMSSETQRYVVEEKPVVEFEPLSQLTVLNSNTSKIDVIVELIKYLQQPDKDLRHEAILKLAQIGDYRGIEPLTEILPQVSPTEQSLVLKAIIQITERSLQPIEEVLFSNPDSVNSEIKQNAISDLSALYAFVAPIKEQLAQMQGDRDMQVRQTATIAIEQLSFYLPCLFNNYLDSAEL